MNIRGDREPDWRDVAGAQVIGVPTTDMTDLGGGKAVATTLEGLFP